MRAPTGSPGHYMLGCIKLALFRILDTCRVLPLPWRYRIADLCSVVAAALMSRGRLAVRNNLHLILERPASLREVVAVFREYGRYWAELADLNGFWKNSSCEFQGDFPPRERAFVGLTFHLGNFEVFGQALRDVLDEDFNVVAERLTPPFLAEYFRRKRAGHHIRTIAHDDVRTLVSCVKNRRHLGIVCDRMISGAGVLMPLFGTTVRLPLGIVDVARRENIPVYVAYCVKDHGVLKIVGHRFDPSETVETITAGVVRLLEEAVRAHPFQWHVLSQISPT